MAPGLDIRQQLLSMLPGQSLDLPDLQALFHHWPRAENPELAHLQEDVDNRLKW